MLSLPLNIGPILAYVGRHHRLQSVRDPEPAERGLARHRSRGDDAPRPQHDQQVHRRLLLLPHRPRLLRQLRLPSPFLLLADETPSLLDAVGVGQLRLHAHASFRLCVWLTE